MKVIYLDDEEQCLELAKVVSEDYPDIELTTVISDKELFYELDKSDYDYIILDLNLGFSMTGTILAEKIRRRGYKGEIIVYSNFEKERSEYLLSSKKVDNISVEEKFSCDIGQLFEQLK